MKDIIGIGALNLDLMYEVDDLAALREKGWPLHTGRELSLSPHQFQQLVQELGCQGTLRSRSGGGVSSQYHGSPGQDGVWGGVCGEGGGR